MSPRPAQAEAAEARRVVPLRAELSAADQVELAVLAARRGTTIQALAGQAIRDLLARVHPDEVQTKER